MSRSVASKARRVRESFQHISGHVAVAYSVGRVSSGLRVDFENPLAVNGVGKAVREASFRYVCLFSCNKMFSFAILHHELFIETLDAANGDNLSGVSKRKTRINETVAFNKLMNSSQQMMLLNRDSSRKNTFGLRRYVICVDTY